MRWSVAVLVSLGAATQAETPQPKTPPPPALALEDRVRLAEALSLMAAVQDEVWPGWSQPPSDLVLVAGDFEYLLRSPQRPEGFAPLPTDPLLGSVLVRKRTFQPDLLATFPAFGPIPVIVVGTAKATGKSSTDWVLSLLHEHFHQLQYADAGYWEESRALGLAGNDESGMWMLNYPFPYQSASPSFASLSRELARIMEAPTTARPAQREAFWRHYSAFCGSLRAEDRRYLSFQLWQEGIARDVELRVAEVAASKHRVSRDFAGLADYRSFADAAASLRQAIINSLQADRMETEKRIVFYAFGAGLGMLLDQEGASWRRRYLREKFYLEKYRSSLGATP